MADTSDSKPKAKPKEKKTVLPWGMSGEVLKPNTIKAIPQTKLKAFSLGRTNPMKKANPFMKKKEEREEKRKIEAKEAAEVYEQFLASFEGSGKAGKTFVRGSTTIDPSTGSERPASPTPSQKFYKPSSKYISKMEEKKESKPEIKLPPPITAKPEKKKGTEKKLSFLELFREELKRSQEERKKRHAAKEEGSIPLDAPDPDATAEIFKVDEYRDFMRGSFDTGDPLTTNLYVGNINPKMNEEMLCQIYGKFGPLASVKVMWPRTEEERARNRNCGFVAYMKRENAEKALEATRGSTIMDFDIQVGWGKAVPLPPQAIYIPPDMQEEENAKVPDPPSGLPFNAQSRKKKSGSGGSYGSVPPPGRKDEGEETFEDLLYNSLVRVVIPTDIELLMLIHRMIEFVIREGPMFEAMIMNKELNNPTFQFLFDNQSPAHIYYRWKLFSILNGDSPETWRIEEFRMFEAGSIWKPPPLKNLRAKVMPPIVEEVVKKGQLSAKNRDDLEDQLRGMSMERSKIKGSMVWCLDHAESAEEIVDCVSESLCIDETPLPMKIARLYLVTDILQNCSSSIPNASNFRRGFEGRLIPIVEHFHIVLKGISSRMRAASFKRRVLVCMRAWNQSSVYHFHMIDKLRETFIGKTHEELEKQKAFETVAALIGVPEKEGGNDSIDRMPILLENKPIDFSRGGNVDGVPMEGDLDGEPLGEADIDGVPLSKEEDLDGVPMEEEPTPATSTATAAPVRSKWELVDYGDESDDKEDENDKSPSSQGGGASTGLSDKQKQQLLAELDERKRKILREVELKVVELSDALEAGGSYNKSEIQERVSKYRDKLMQEAVEPKRTSKSESGSSSKSKTKGRRSRSRSPSPSTLAKYDLDESSHQSRSSPRRSRKRSRSQSTERDQTTEIDRSSSAKKRKSSSSPKRLHSHSPGRSKSRSPARTRSKSRSPARKQSKSRSPARKRSKSRSPARKRSKSRSPSRKRSKSRSPTRKRSKSRSPTRKRSRSPGRKRSRSPGRKRSRSPTRRRSKSPSRRRSKSPTRKRSRSRSRGRKRSRSRSPTRKKSRSRSPRKRRSRSRSPKRSSSSKHRSRSRSPRSRKHRSRSRSPKSSSKKTKRRSRSRSKSPHKSSKSSSKKSKH